MLQRDAEPALEHAKPRWASGVCQIFCRLSLTPHNAVQAGVQMFIALFIIALSLKFIDNGDKSGRDKNNLPKIWEAWYVLAFTCMFDNAYAWSWGPLGESCCHESPAHAAVPTKS